jgi:hypothetical protein
MLEKDAKKRIDIFEIDSELQEFSVDLFEGKYYRKKSNNIKSIYFKQP